MSLNLGRAKIKLAPGAVCLEALKMKCTHMCMHKYANSFECSMFTFVLVNEHLLITPGLTVTYLNSDIGVYIISRVTMYLCRCQC